MNEIKTDLELLSEWADRVEQSMRDPVAFEHESSTALLTELCTEIDAVLSKVRASIELGREIEMIRCRSFFEQMELPLGSRKRLIRIGEDSLTISEWSEKIGIPCRVIAARMRAGWDGRDAVLTPYGRREQTRSKRTTKEKAVAND